MQFKYQTLFSCHVPDGYKTVKDFNEMIATDEPMSVDVLLQTIKLSFENAGVAVHRMDLSNDLNHCDIILQGEDTPIKVIIRTRPSLVVGDQIFKLEEFDF